METTTATAPAYWAPYLINGDASGMTNTEVHWADTWVAHLAEDGWRIVSADGEAEFRHGCDALFKWNGDVLVYLLHK